MKRLLRSAWKLFVIVVWGVAALTYLGICCVVIRNIASNYSAAKEGSGRTPNTQDADAARTWTVCLYGGSSKLAAWKIGGGDFRRLASGVEYTHRINARSGAEASRLFAELIKDAEQRHATVSTVAVMDHAWIAEPQICGSLLPDEFYEVAGIAATRVGLKRIVFLGCYVAGTEKGLKFARDTARRTNVDVLAATIPVNGLALEIHRFLPRAGPASDALLAVGEAVEVKPDGSVRALWNPGT